VDNDVFDLNCETNITVHFENVNFIAGGSQISVIRNAVATLTHITPPPPHRSNMQFSTTTFPPNLAHIAECPTSPLITSPSSMFKSSVFLHPIGFIQPFPPVQSGYLSQPLNPFENLHR
jgi:hypothetical protein